MEEVKLTAFRRHDAGKGVARKLRQSGSIPGILYGPEIDPFAVSLNGRELAALFRGEGNANRLIDLVIDGEKENRKVIIRELQRDPISGDMEHIDLYQVSLTKKIHITTKVRLTGVPEGVKLGGIIQHILRELDIACLPTDIPEHVTVDVSALNIGDSIHVKDISIEKADILTSLSGTIVTVVPPTIIKTKAEEAAEAAAAAGAEAEEGAVEGAEGEAAAETSGEEKKDDKKDAKKEVKKEAKKEGK